MGILGYSQWLVYVTAFHLLMQLESNSDNKHFLIKILPLSVKCNN